MPSFTLKNIPEALMDKLREQAQSNRRSLAKELQRLLENAFAGPGAPAKGWPGGARETEPRYSTLVPRGDDRLVSRDAQVEAWRDLCGQWQSDLDPAAEIDAIYAARSAGREVDL